MVWFVTFLEKKIDLYSSNLNVPDISFQPLSNYIKALVKKTPTLYHSLSAVQHNITMGQCYCFGASALREGHHM